METALPLNAFVKSDIAFSARFDSPQITLDDALALIQFLKSVMDAAQSEISSRIGQEFEILPVVTVSSGSVEIRVDVKPNTWSFSVRASAREVFLSIGLLLNPGSVVSPPAQPPPPLSAPCEELIEVSCGGTKVRSSVKSSPPESH